MKVDSRYKHTERIHNLQSPNEIVPLLYRMFQPNSVIDVGCGTGTFLFSFKKEGVEDVLGIDGKWADNELLQKHLKESEFVCQNLEEPFSINRRFDMVISLEVAEHLAPEYAEDFVKTLISLGDLIIFSAAVPFQGGTNHFNEQWPTYWEKLFNKYNYHFYDLIRPAIWDNEKIFTWYKQNIFVVSNKKQDALNSYKNIIHPELYLSKTTRLNDIEKGNMRLRFYLKILSRALKNNFSKTFGRSA